MLRADHAAKVAAEVDLAALPARSLEVARDGGGEPPMVVAGDEFDPAQPALLEPFEELLVGCLAFGVGLLDGQDLPPPVVAHPGHDEHPQADHPPVHARVLVAGVDDEVRVGRRRQPPGAPRG